MLFRTNDSGFAVSPIALAGLTVMAGTAAAQERPPSLVQAAPAEEAEDGEEIVVQATRTGRRVQDEPIRVEVLDREEIEEKVLMQPGNISMLVSETPGLRVQVTSPALGAANVRVQGLKGRYTQVLADGLPLYGGQTPSIGLLQIPPTDLGQVEIIKGAASALCGPSALGGVINLVSRRPSPASQGELLLNATSRGGQDEATLRRATEPFFSTKGVGKGTGLGLSMVDGLAAQLGGGLLIKSTPDYGTDVELWLPISLVVVDSDDQTPPMAPATVSPGIALLVDDEELVRMSTADMLADLGYEVVEARSAEEAIRFMDQGLTPALLVTDHLMPGMSGADLARKLKADRPSLPVLIVSGYAEVAGVDADVARLTKPFRNSELAMSVSALMASTS